MAWNKI